MKLYFHPASQYSRTVLLTAQALGVEFEEIFIDSVAGETKKPEFVAMNPQHTVPTLDDDGFILWESKAIMGYLVAKFAKDDSLYPKDIKKRAIVDRFLNFDTGYLIRRFYTCVLPVVFKGQTSFNQDDLKSLYDALDLLNIYLKGTKFAVGDTITIADHALVSSISSITAAGFSLKNYPNIASWFERCQKEMKGYAIAQRGLGDFAKFFSGKTAGLL